MTRESIDYEAREAVRTVVVDYVYPICSTPPSLAVKVGGLWVDTNSAPPVLKICTSLDPLTYVASSGGGGSHPDLASHDALGLAKQTELDALAAAKADVHAHDYEPAGAVETHRADTTVIHGITDTANLVFTNDARLSDARTPTSHGDAAHSALSYEASGAVATHAAAADPHTGYLKENDPNWVDLTDGGATTLHSHAGGPGGGINTLRTTSNQTINAGAGVFTDITGLTFPVVSGTDYAFEFYITFQSAAATTGWRAGVNCPAGALDFWAGSQTIANGAAGVATHTERHNVTRDDMTLLTATVTQAVDLNVRIVGRYCCTANGTFAARFANELAANTQVVVQKGSWGRWW